MLAANAKPEGQWSDDEQWPHETGPEAEEHEDRGAVHRAA
jgi:hypothetical protein